LRQQETYAGGGGDRRSSGNHCRLKAQQDLSQIPNLEKGIKVRASH
jgi:hypothetical protein